MLGRNTGVWESRTLLTESRGRKTSTASGLSSFVQPAQTHNTHNDWRIWRIVETPSKAIRSYPSPLHLRRESNMQLKAKKHWTLKSVSRTEKSSNRMSEAVLHLLNLKRGLGSHLPPAEEETTVKSALGKPARASEQAHPAPCGGLGNTTEGWTS